MGTGSFGGGSSGALGHGSSGAQGASAPRTGKGSSGFFSVQTGGRSPTMDSARLLLRDTFAQRRVGDYMTKMIASSAVGGCFEELFLVAGLLTEQKGWPAIAKDYGVRDGPGCLNELSTAIKRKHISAEPIEAFREIAAAAVDDIMLAAIGENDDLYLDGRASDVFAAINKSGDKVFASLSGHFFGSVLFRAATRELPALSGPEKVIMRKAAQERADFIIAKFEEAFFDKEQIRHRQLLQVLIEKGEWFRDKLRESLGP
jgi:hypothetical protein